MSRPMTSFSLVILLACGAPSLAPEDGALATPGQDSLGLQPSGPRVGDACAPDCIWSGDAITVGGQEPTENCSGAPCACVLVGDTDRLCVAGEDAGMPPDAGAVDASAPKTPANAVPYFCQYDNALHPGASCQNTSVAMVLASLGWQGHPDDITREWGKDYAQSPSNLGRMFNAIASDHQLDGRLETRIDGALEDFRSAAAAGRVLIVHGYFTSYGHVLVVTGFDGERYTVNDPAGQWSEAFKGGYSDMPRNGHGVTYARTPFEAAVATSDGSTFMPLWYHTLRRLEP